ncbi:MAG: maleylpyruvate isomerase N-terminal domain-containing protein [Nitriliruptorales bacterium]
MGTRTIPTEALGMQAVRLMDRERAELLAVLKGRDGPDWNLKTGFRGMTVTELVQHMVEDSERLADAWERHYSHLDEPLFWALEHPEEEHALEEDPAEPDELVERYSTAMERVRTSLAQARLDDWEWPSVCPLGGLETLSEAARRWLAHHYVHREDIHEILGLPPDNDEETVSLVVEFTLHALVMVGGDSMPYPMAMKVITAPPGSGAWTLVFADPDEREDRFATTWEKFLGWESEPPPERRVERGTGPGTRVSVRGYGEAVWRAGFGRGHSWDELQVHGDDEAVQAWERLTEMLDGSIEKRLPSGKG